jgi:23S rRNA pseudouridine1911/1915/1917 synthase
VNTESIICQVQNERLDSYVAGIRNDLSRSQVQRLIREGHILVNGHAARPSARLQQKDRIDIHVPDALDETVVPEDIPLRIVYEDEHVLVVDKPPGLTVHPSPGHPRGTLVNALIARYPALESVGAPGRPGLVHRLDKDTSGLLVVALTPEAHAGLSRQLRERTVAKVYLALVRGHPEPSEGLVEAAISRDPRHRQRMGVVEGGRAAATRYTTVRRFNGYTLLEVRPHTGRTHQIRVHMSAMGHPVAGDSKYGGRAPFLKRQFLHAHRLGFGLPPGGERVEFESPLPPDLEEALAGRALHPGSPTDY